MQTVILSFILILANPSNVYNPELPAHLLKEVNKFNEQQIECLAKNIYFEARSEKLAGQMSVAFTTLRRMELEEYPDTVCGVVYQYKAFSWAYLIGKNYIPKKLKKKYEQKKHGLKIYNRYKSHIAKSIKPRDKKVYEKIKKVAERAFYGYSIANWKADHYHLKSIKPKWRNDKGMQKLFTIENHIFYQRYSTVYEKLGSIRIASK